MFGRLSALYECISVAGLFVVLILLPTTSTAATSETERQVAFHPANKHEAVVITKVMLGNVVVQAGRFERPSAGIPDEITPFHAGDDWIQALTFYLFNRTNKTIVYLSAHFSFPETGDGRIVPRRDFHLILGRIPTQVAFDQHGTPFSQPADRTVIAFKGGQIMAIALGEYSDKIRADIEPSIPLSVATKLNFDLEPVYFEDGMQGTRRFRMLDPQTRTWRPLDLNFFPGDMDRNWPGRPGWPEAMSR